MSAFRDSAHAATVLGGFFRQERAEDDRIFAGSGLILGYALREPNVRIVLDSRRTPVPGNAFDVYVDDASAPLAELEFSMEAETFDKLLRGEIQPVGAMMSGKLKASGNTGAAMRMLPAMARLIPRYKKYRENN